MTERRSAADQVYKGDPIKHSARIAGGLNVEFVLDERGARCLWTPDFPRQLRGQAMRRYLAARATFYQRIATLRDMRILSIGMETLEPSTGLYAPVKAGRA